MLFWLSEEPGSGHVTLGAAGTLSTRGSAPRGLAHARPLPVASHLVVPGRQGKGSRTAKRGLRGDSRTRWSAKDRGRLFDQGPRRLLTFARRGIRRAWAIRDVCRVGGRRESPHTSGWLPCQPAWSLSALLVSAVVKVMGGGVWAMGYGPIVLLVWGSRRVVGIFVPGGGRGIGQGDLGLSCVNSRDPLCRSALSRGRSALVPDAGSTHPSYGTRHRGGALSCSSVACEPAGVRPVPWPGRPVPPFARGILVGDAAELCAFRLRTGVMKTLLA